MFFSYLWYDYSGVWKLSGKGNIKDEMKKIRKLNKEKEINASEELVESIKKIGEELKKSNDKTKWDKRLKFIPLLTLLSTIVIAVFTIIISSSNLETVKNNQKLTYDTNVLSVKGSKLELEEDTKGNQKIKLPMKIENTIESGKIKVIYVVTKDADEDTGYRFIKLNYNAENGFDYIMNGTVDQLKRLSINFFVYYIDMSDNIYYDYVVVFAEYHDVVNNIIIKNEDNSVVQEENRKKIILKKSNMAILSQYDFVTSTIYDEKVKVLNKNLNLEIQSYNNIKQMSREISKILKSNI